MEWISVKDRSPEQTGYYLTYRRDSMDVYQYAAIHRKFNSLDTPKGDKFAVEDISHWMPLPEPPKEATT